MTSERNMYSEKRIKHILEKGLEFHAGRYRLYSEDNKWRF